MSCNWPLQAYKLHNIKTEKGKQKIVLKRHEIPKGAAYTALELPCGTCEGCRMQKAKEWACRCYHESTLYLENVFATLTYEDDELPPYMSLTKGRGSDWTNFIRRLRRAFPGRKIRYFQCGEYGDETKRPHHHACLFNVEFYDKVLWSVRNGVRLYHSELLDEIWTHGRCIIGDVTVESAAYIAKYVMKKLKGSEPYIRINEQTGEVYELEKEYVTMSRKPGIGQGWIERFMDTDVKTKDYFTVNGKKYRVPRYYDEIMSKVDKDYVEAIKLKRRVKCRKRDDNGLQRRLVKGNILKRRLQRQERSRI